MAREALGANCCGAPIGVVTRGTPDISAEDVTSLAVIHLVRACNGVAPFSRFIESYRRCPAGVPHHLILVFKGFGALAEISPFKAIADGIDYRILEVDDRGFDIGSYRRASLALDQQYVCCLNSFSEILHAGWLEKLYRRAVDPRIGAVGVCGSYESLFSTLLAQQAMRPAAGIYGRVRASLRRGLYRHLFPPFPNPHLRSNGFVIERERFVAIRPRRLMRKLDVLEFESGRRGLTAWLLMNNLRAVIVGADDRMYEVNEWRESETWASGAQRNLLIADNRTSAFQCASPAARAVTTWGAWEQDRPFPELRDDRNNPALSPRR